MAMTTLQQMVHKDAYDRLRQERPEVFFSLYTEYAIPTDREIKENGYEGAVDNVYQQMLNDAGEKTDG